MSKNIIKKFPKTTLQELVSEEQVDGLEVISNTIVDHTRWSVVYEVIFKEDYQFYKVSYSVGATESQDEGPFEYDNDEIDCIEVAPVEKTIVVYEPVGH